MTDKSQMPLPTEDFIDPRTGKISRSWFLYLRDLTRLVNAPANAWPIGSIFTTVDTSAPSDLLGFGTWEAFGEGRVMVGLKASDPDFDTAGETGGAKTSVSSGTVSQPTFTGNALGTHSHGVGTIATSAHAGTAVANHVNHTHPFTQSSNAGTPDLVAVDVTGAGVAASGTTGNESPTLTHSVTQPDAHTLSGSTAAVSAGTPAGTVSQPNYTGAAQSIVQSYIVVYMWKRTA